MPEDEPVTRRETDMRQAAADAEHVRLWQQIASTRKEVRQVRTDMNERFEDHEKVHDRDAAARLSAHRWRVGMGVAAASSVAAVLGLLIELLAKVH